MGYKQALEAAGARVIVFEQFGSYQGDWLAKVEYGDQIGWVHGSYGSCSGCDAFEAEFGYNDEDPKMLAAFGVQYLTILLTQEEAEKIAEKDLEWDMEAKPMIEFVKQNANTF